MTAVVECIGCQCTKEVFAFFEKFVCWRNKLKQFCWCRFMASQTVNHETTGTRRKDAERNGVACRMPCFAGHVLVIQTDFFEGRHPCVLTEASWDIESSLCRVFENAFHDSHILMCMETFSAVAPSHMQWAQISHTHTLSCISWKQLHSVSGKLSPSLSACERTHSRSDVLVMQIESGDALGVWSTSLKGSWNKLPASLLTFGDRDVVIHPDSRWTDWWAGKLVQRQCWPLLSPQSSGRVAGRRVAEWDLAIDHLFPQVSQGTITGPVVGV